MKFYLIINPHSGGKNGQKLLRLVKPIFESAGIELSIIETTFAGHARELANQLDFSGYDGFITIGGDGTIHEVVNGLLPRFDKKQIPIGVIPGGSGNSFMYDLDLLDPVKAARAIIDGNTRQIDVAEVKINHVTKYAVNIIGWGLVTDVGKKAERFRWLGESRYTFTSLIEVITQSPRYAKLLLDEKQIIDDYTFIIACNTIHTGKGMKMAPKAKLDDGLIDVVVVKYGISRFKLLSLLPKLFDGSHIENPIVEHYQVKEFSLIPVDDEILNIDGEILGSTPINVKMIPKAFTVFCK